VIVERNQVGRRDFRLELRKMCSGFRPIAGAARKNQIVEVLCPSIPLWPQMVERKFGLFDWLPAVEASPAEPLKSCPKRLFGAEFRLAFSYPVNGFVMLV
jgi:hypothetical protein